MHKRFLSGLSILLLLLLSQPGRSRSVMAQTPAPTQNPPRNHTAPGSPGSEPWLWWLLILAAGGGVIGWLSRRQRSSTAVPPTTASPPRIPPVSPTEATESAARATASLPSGTITPEAGATPPPTSYTAVTQLPAMFHPPLEEIMPEPMPPPSDIASPTVEDDRP
jgi:hypothetical protein